VASASDSTVMAKYKQGYAECVQECLRFVSVPNANQPQATSVLPPPPPQSTIGPKSSISPTSSNITAAATADSGMRQRLIANLMRQFQTINGQPGTLGMGMTAAQPMVPILNAAAAVNCNIQQLASLSTINQQAQAHFEQLIQQSIKRPYINGCNGGSKSSSTSHNNSKMAQSIQHVASAFKSKQSVEQSPHSNSSESIESSSSAISLNDSLSLNNTSSSSSSHEAFETSSICNDRSNQINNANMQNAMGGGNQTRASFRRSSVSPSCSSTSSSSSSATISSTASECTNNNESIEITYQKQSLNAIAIAAAAAAAAEAATVNSCSFKPLLYSRRKLSSNAVSNSLESLNVQIEQLANANGDGMEFQIVWRPW
jgi:hypothetical protein